MHSGESTGEPTTIPAPSLARFAPWLHEVVEYDHLDILDDDPEQLQRARLAPPTDGGPQTSEPPVVALKRPTLPDGKTLDREDQEEFVQEAQTWAEVHDHPHVPTVIGWGDDPTPWLAVEYADRGSLADYTDDTDAPLGVQQAVWIGECLADALDYAHACDDYHHDVTPHNVLLFQSDDGWPVPKLGDWGLARARNDQSRQPFTPGYGAPEQRRPERYYRVHPRKTDLYQLGTILYELLTGELPFSRHERHRKHLESPQPPSQHREDISGDGPLDTLVTELLAPSPDARPQSMGRVVTRLATCRERLQTSDSTTQDRDTSVSVETSDPVGDSEPDDVSVAADDSSPTEEQLETELSVESNRVECEKRVVTRETATDSRVAVGYELRSHRESAARCELSDPLPPGVDRQDLSITEGAETGEWEFTEQSVEFEGRVDSGETIQCEYSVDGERGPDPQYLDGEPTLETVTPTPDNWKTFHANGRRSGAGGGCVGPDPPISTRWQFDTDGEVESSPAVADGTVYVGSGGVFDESGSLYAVDAATGDQQWQFDTDGPVQSSPAVVEGTVYVGSNDNCLYAVDAVTGDQQWQFDTSHWVQSSPVVADGTVYVGSSDSSLYAVDAQTGDERWRFDASDWVSSSPTVADGTVYVGSDDRNLYAVSAATGTRRWRIETSGDVAAATTVVDGTVYVGCGGALDGNGSLYAVDATTGEQQWQFDTAGAVESSPAVADGTVYVGSSDNSLYAVDAATGDQQWQFDTAGPVRSSPAVADGTVYVGSDDHSLYAVDTTTGTGAWQFDTLARVRSSPAVIDGTVYVGSDDHSLYAVAGTD